MGSRPRWCRDTAVVLGSQAHSPSWLAALHPDSHGPLDRTVGLARVVHEREPIPVFLGQPHFRRDGQHLEAPIIDLDAHLTVRTDLYVPACSHGSFPLLVSSLHHLVIPSRSKPRWTSPRGSP